MPKEAEGLGNFLNFVLMRKKGHLWQGRYFSSVMDESYLLTAGRYVEQNPCRAKMVGNPWDYVWSSARTHVGMEKDPIIRTTGKDRILRMIPGGLGWKGFLTSQDTKRDEDIRIKTAKGYAIGGAVFVTGLEDKLGLRLSEGKPGRPKK